MNGRSRIAVAFIFTVIMLGTNLPSPLYPLYEKSFDLPSWITPIIFGTYAAGVIGALLFLGYLSDEVGRKPLMAISVALSAASAVVFLIAPNLAWLLVGRFLSGVSSGIATGAATAWLVDGKKKEEEKKATLLGVAANVGGLAIGPLLAGTIARFTSIPLRLPYGADLGLLALAALALLFTEETVKKKKPVHFRMQSLHVPSSVRERFVTASLAGVCGFAVAGVVSAVGPSLLGHDLNVKSPLAGGALVGAFFFGALAGQLGVARLSKQHGLLLGSIALLAGLAILAFNLLSPAVVTLFAASATAGLGQGLGTGAGLGDVNEHVDEKRGETDSFFFVLAYAGVSIPVIGVGLLAAKIGLASAGLTFCALTFAGVLMVLVRSIRQPAC